MTDNNKTEQSTLAENFNSANSALIIDANFANKKVAIGEIFILENNRIEPSSEDKAQRFGMSPEMLAEMPEAAAQSVKESFIESQTERFSDARDRTIVTYENYLKDADHALIEVRDIALSSLEVELSLVQDGSLSKNVQNKISEGASAEVAMDEAYEETINQFRAMDNPYFQKTVVELEQHRATMQHHLHPDKSLATLNDIKEGTLLVSPTFPLHALSSFRDNETGQTLVNGTITDAGSLESHGAILITGMGIPYARVNNSDMDRMKNGDKAIMDGASGQLLLHPNKETIELYEQKVDTQNNQSDVLVKKSAKKKTATTTDGEKINIHANFAISDESHDLKKSNPVGIGLYRTEIAATMRENQIDAETWKSIFKHNMSASASNDTGYIGTTIRTLDFAGDKSDLPKEEREELQQRMTKEQMRGLLLLQQDLSEEGQAKKLKVMVPTVSSTEDMHSMQTMMDDEAKDMGLNTIKLGCMVEVPSLITELDKLDVSFMSVGSNDLIHDLLGIDRYDSESIKKYDPTNPAVLKALDQVHLVAEERNIPFSICGNMASDPKYTALLIGAGFTNMSAKIDSVPIVKEMVSRIDTEEARNLFNTIKDIDTRAEREIVLEEFNETLGLDANGKLNMQNGTNNNEHTISRDHE